MKHKKKPGRRIESLAELIEASRNKRAVIVPGHAGRRGPWGDPTPAAVMVHLSGAMIHNLITFGLYIYGPEETERKSK